MMSLKELAEKETESYFRLTKHVIDLHAKGRNLLFSPLSIHVVLAMTAAGSSGSTRAQLLAYLKSARVDQLNSFFSQILGTVLADGSPLGGPHLSTKNGLWVDRSLALKPAFRDIVHNFYNAAAENVDFQNQAKAVIKQVNDWCNKETRGLIKEILPPHSLDEETRLVLANAVYFKGEWVREFDPSLTRDRNFYLLDGTRLRAPSMSSYYPQCVRAFNGFKVAKLPYKQGKDNDRAFSMYIYLPDARDGLSSLMERIYSEPGFIDRHLPHGMEELDAFWIPRFKIDFEFEASQVMKELGVGDLFEMADLTEMVVDAHDGECEPLSVTTIRHKAFVEVNEAGSEAAAVTEEDCDMGCGLYEEAPPPRMRFEPDHPFLFLIREDTTGVVLFVGQLLDPLEPCAGAGGSELQHP